MVPAAVMLVVPPANVTVAVDEKLPVPVKLPVMEKSALAVNTPPALMFSVVILNTEDVVSVAAASTTTGPNCVVPAPVNAGVVPPKEVLPVDPVKLTVPVLFRVPSMRQATVPAALMDPVTFTLLKVLAPAPDKIVVPLKAMVPPPLVNVLVLLITKLPAIPMVPAGAFSVAAAATVAAPKFIVPPAAMVTVVVPLKVTRPVPAFSTPEAPTE